MMQLLLHEEIPSSIQIHPIISMKARTEQSLSKKKKKAKVIQNKP